MLFIINRLAYFLLKIYLFQFNKVIDNHQLIWSFKPFFVLF